MAAERWPDRTLGDNRMWFEAKTVRKEEKKKEEEENHQAGFSGKEYP